MSIVDKIESFIKEYPGVEKFHIIKEQATSRFGTKAYLKILVWANKEKFDARETIDALTGKKSFKEEINEFASYVYLIKYDIYFS